MIDVLILCAAGFLAGALNAVAGGGTFISLPALILVGVPPLMANATATLTALPGYLASAWAFRQDVRDQPNLPLARLAALAALGGVLGAILLTVTPEQAFDGIVPWLLVVASVLFAAGPYVLARIARAGQVAGAWPIALSLLAVCIYGGYFNGGLGIMVLATFGLLGFSDLNAMNGLKAVVAAVLSTLSVVTFVFAGLIAWDPVIIMAIATAVGSVTGAKLSRRITNVLYLRLFILCVGLTLAAVFWLT